MADVDVPVTNVSFVCSEEDCPDDYTVISECPCGHEAQLWEKVLGGKEGTRFICFTKQDTGDGTVIEDMYIPSRSVQYLYKGYKIVKHTLDGNTPMRHKQLAVKRVPRSEAKKVVVDVIVCRSRDKISKLYKRLDKVNGLCICYRVADYKPPTALSKPQLTLRQPSPNLRRATVTNPPKPSEDQDEKSQARPRASSDSGRRKLSTPSPPSSPEPDEPDEEERGSPISQSPIPPVVVEEMATMHIVSNVAASAPPSQDSTSQPASYQATPPPPPQASNTTTQPATGSYYPPPSSAPTTYNTAATNRYPPPSATTNTYPPPSAAYNTAPNTYPPTNTAPNTGYNPATGSSGGYYAPYPPPATATPPTGGYPQAYNTSIGFNTGQQQQGIPPQPPGGYSSIAGSGYSGVSYSTPNTTATSSTPYNPYTQQPSNQQSGRRYGFNF